jgi:hypothetical protein
MLERAGRMARVGAPDGRVRVVRAAAGAPRVGRRPPAPRRRAHPRLHQAHPPRRR